MVLTGEAPKFVDQAVERRARDAERAGRLQLVVAIFGQRALNQSTL